MGKPVAKIKPRLGKDGGARQRIKNYENKVKEAARIAMSGKDPFCGDVCVSIEAYVYRPMDCDNIAKCLLDGMKGVCYEDDFQVVELIIRKYKSNYNNQYTKIKVNNKISKKYKLKMFLLNLLKRKENFK